MPIIGGVLGFRAGGGDTIVLGNPPTIEVITASTEVAVSTPIVTIDVGTDTVEVVQP